jgi:hypothetical protein
MEEVETIHERANAAFSSAFRDLDRHVRPVQQDYFKCCLAASAPERGPEAVPDLISACQAPLRRVQEALAERQEGFQRGVRACHGAAGAAVAVEEGAGAADKPPTPAQVSAYVAALRPCVEREVGAIGALLGEVRALVPAARADIKAATPRSGSWLW